MADEAGHYMPWAIPEFVGRDSCFLQAWSSAMFNWLIVQGLFRLQPDPLTGAVVVRPQLPSDWASFAVTNLTLWGGRYDLRLERTADGIKFSAEQQAPGAINANFQVDMADTLPATFA